MKFENRGKWLKEAEDKLAAYDTQEHPDFLDGDNKVCTFEDGEITNFEEDDLDVIEEDDTLDSPEDEEMDLAMEAAMPPMGQRKRIEFEDDIVKVYDGNKEIYAGAEDYEPMQDEDWKWDNANKYYKFDKYIKVCCESSQKNEFDANSERTLIAKKKEIQKLAAKMGNDNLVQYISLLKKYVDDAYDYALKHFDESSQKNEDALSWYKKFYKDLKEFKKDMQKSYPGDKRDMSNKIDDMLEVIKMMWDGEKFESSQKNEGSNWEYSVSVLDNYGDIQYSTDCKSQSDIDNAIKKYKDRAVELRNADNCRTIEVTKDLVDDDGNILKSQSIKKISL